MSCEATSTTREVVNLTEEVANIVFGHDNSHWECTIANCEHEVTGFGDTSREAEADASEKWAEITGV